MIKSVFIQCVCIIFSYLTPKKKNIIVLGSGNNNQFNGNPKVLLLYLKNHPTIKAYWSTNNKKLYSYLKSKGFLVIYRKSLKGFFTILKAKYLIIEKSANDVYYTSFIFGRFNFIQTWHGMPLKRIGTHAFNDNKGDKKDSIHARFPWLWNFMKNNRLLSMMKYKMVLTLSKNHNKLFSEAFLNNNTKAIGYPRNDVFFNSSLLLENLESKLGFKDYTKVLLYAPTYRDNVSEKVAFTSEGLTKLNETLEKLNYVLYIKKHPFDNQNYMQDGLENIVDVTSKVKDVQELLCFTDVLITDYSSIFNDFVLTQKPIIYYVYDLPEYEKTCRGFYYNFEKTFSGPFIASEKDLVEAISSIEIWSNSDEYKAKYNKHLHQFHDYVDGKSCERLLTNLGY